jgi:type II secretory pathway pseudopilin PulG
MATSKVTPAEQTVDKQNTPEGGEGIPASNPEQVLADAQARADETAAAVTDVPETPVVQNPTLADAPLEVHQAAAIAAGRMATVGNEGLVASTIDAKVGQINEAVQLREAQAQALAAQQQARDAQAEVERLHNAGVGVDPTQPGYAQLRAPLDNPMQKPAADSAPAGISPDVTSPTSGSVGEVKIPGTGVADIRDLAPGQSLAPSPPVSSSNIVPTPNKPGTPFAQL